LNSNHAVLSAARGTGQINGSAADALFCSRLRSESIDDGIELLKAALRYPIEAWAAITNLNAGELIFRAMDQQGFISTERLTDRSVAHIVKSRVKALVKQRGRSEAEAENHEALKIISGGAQTSANVRDWLRARSRI
jgi:hypothetical protein